MMRELAARNRSHRRFHDDRPVGQMRRASDVPKRPFGELTLEI
jgi:hypothetical protein